MTQAARDVIEREAENWFRVHSDTDFEFLGDAIIAALAAACYKIVARGPTDDQTNIEASDVHVWRAMWDAAP